MTHRNSVIHVIKRAASLTLEEVRCQMQRLILISALLLAVLPLPAIAQQAVPFRGDREVTVMSRNLYLGADLGRGVRARNLAEFIAAVTTNFAILQATNFPERAQALADEINATQPDLIGLQEVSLWRSQFPADFSPAPNATTVEFDFLQLLLGAPAARGLQYAPVAISIGFDIEAPRVTPLSFQDIRLTDRDVILVREDLRTADLKLSNISEGHFATNLVVNTVAGPVTIRRGWASVDAKIRGKTFRFVTTHLETEDFAPDAPAVQVAQAEELLQGPANTHLPVVLLGDFNSRADAAPGPRRTASCSLPASSTPGALRVPATPGSPAVRPKTSLTLPDTLPRRSRS